MFPMGNITEWLCLGWTELPMPAAATVSRAPLCQQQLPGHGGCRDSGLEGIMSQPRGTGSWGVSALQGYGDP